MPFVVVLGSGRSGTTYLHKLLQAAGLQCLHESLGPDGGVGLIPPKRYPRLTTHPDLRLCEVIRSPLPCISSLLSFTPYHWQKCESWGFTFPDDPVTRCMQYYITWHNLCAKYTDKMFSLNQLQVPYYQRQFELFIGTKCDWTLPRNINTRKHPSLTWEDLFSTDPQLAQELKTFASTPIFQE
jgi:hypothetical protein